MASLVPCDVARARWPYPVVAVGVDRDVFCAKPPSYALEHYLRAGEIQSSRLSHLLLAQADLAILPEVGGFHWAEFSRAEEIMALGQRAAEAAWPALERVARGPGLLARLGRRLSGKRSPLGAV